MLVDRFPPPDRLALVCDIKRSMRVSSGASMRTWSTPGAIPKHGLATATDDHDIAELVGCLDGLTDESPRQCALLSCSVCLTLAPLVSRCQVDVCVTVGVSPVERQQDTSRLTDMSVDLKLACNRDRRSTLQRQRRSNLAGRSSRSAIPRRLTGTLRDFVAARYRLSVK